MKGLYRKTGYEGIARQEETVETVYRISCITDHRAEAAVLMRSLRVTLIPILPKVQRLARVKRSGSKKSLLLFPFLSHPDGARTAALLPWLNPDNEVADGDLLIGHHFGALFAW
jgi:hypothetical protein